MTERVLDASAVLAALWLESGHERVAQALAEGARMTTVNLSEVAAKLSDSGVPDERVREALARFEEIVMDFSTELAFRAALLRPITRDHGLSLGDRACLALALQLRIPVLTADRQWARLRLDIPVELIR